MAFEFKLPDLGEGIREAQVLAWKVTPGQQVAAFQPLCEVESAKAAVELTAPVAGRVRETRFAEGDIARLGDVLVVIDTDGGSSNGDAAERGSRNEAGEAGSSSTRGAGAALRAGEPEWFGIVGSPPRAARAAASSAGEAGAERPTPVRAAPFVRKLARDLGVRLEDVSGSGPQGRVRIADVEARAVRPAESARRAEPARPAAAEQQAAAPLAAAEPQAAMRPVAAAASDARTSIPLRGLRKSIADHMVQAWRSAPQVTSMDLLDVTELVRARELLLAAAQAQGVRLTYLPFFVKAAVEALKTVPIANSRIDEPNGVIVLEHEYHIGIATAVPDGLVVPVVKHADRLSLLEIAREMDRLVSAARDRRATPADLSGGTFTITSFGGLPGSPMFATPILNYPEVAILGLGRVDLQPRVVDGQVVPRSCLGISLTFDHRAMDGEGAGRFMAALRKYVEQPLELLLTLR